MDDLNYLREQQRLLLAEKAEKERKLAELMKGTKQSKPKGYVLNTNSFLSPLGS
jgi:hypothetical protein